MRGIDPALLADLAAEQTSLDELLATLSAAEWERPTPAAGWTIADQVRHLAVSERAAGLAVAGRSEEVFGEARRPAMSSESSSESSSAALLEAWRAARTRTLTALSGLGDRDRVIWGAGPMSARSFADARLMETWAHGLDCFAAVGIAPVETARLHRIAGLGHRALPYAFALAGEHPAGDVRNLALDLTGPDGTPWWFGPTESTDVITGTAGDWCRVATRRRRARQTSLRATTALGWTALEVARAYLADGAVA
jgi:uncharacterized protein (TIGR03084 family)